MKINFDDGSYIEYQKRDDKHYITVQAIDTKNSNKKIINSGMIPKAKACVNAIRGGVKKAHILNADVPHALLLEMFTDMGIGTEIVK